MRPERLRCRHFFKLSADEAFRTQESEGKQRTGQSTAAGAQNAGPSRRDSGAAPAPRPDGGARAAQVHAAQAPAAAKSPSKIKPAKAAPARKGQTSEIFAHLPQYRVRACEQQATSDTQRSSTHLITTLTAVYLLHGLDRISSRSTGASLVLNWLVCRQSPLKMSFKRAQLPQKCTQQFCS